MRLFRPISMAVLLLTTYSLSSCVREKSKSDVDATRVFENTLTVDVVRPAEDLSSEEQKAAFLYAREKIIAALKESKVGRVPGANNLFSAIGSVDLSQVVEQTNLELAKFEEKLKLSREHGSGLSQASLYPKGYFFYFGIPSSMSASVGLSGAANLYLVMKPSLVERIDKRTSTVVGKWWELEVALKGGLGVGGGVGAGGGVTLQGVGGAIWGNLPSPKTFGGVVASVSFSPAATLVAPIVAGGAIWNNGQVAKAPDLTFFGVGGETGAAVKVGELHTRVGTLGDAWGILKSLLNMSDTASFNGKDPATGVAFEKINAPMNEMDTSAMALTGSDTPSEPLLSNIVIVGKIEK
jgi:hypothetical protein